jgi:predicted permease
MLSDLTFRLRALFRRDAVEAELDDELRAHFEKQVEKYEASGLTREESLRRARLDFGGQEQWKEECRDARGVTFLDTLTQDVRFGLRVLRKNPGFAVIAVLTLALGIGASASVFSVVNAILLKPLPYPNADRIVIPWLISPPGVNIGSEYFPWGQIQYRMVMRENYPFQNFGVFQNDSFNLTGSGEPVLLDGYRTSEGFFPALGVSPILGRTYSPEEDQPGHEHVVVLSYRLWQERFGGDRDVFGRLLVLNGFPYTVIGVMPADFAFPRSEEMPVSFNFPRRPMLWVPSAIPATPKLGPSELAAIGRLKPNMTLAQAQAQMDVITKHAEQADPRWKGWFNTRLVPLENQVVGDTQRPLLLILGSVGIVLLIACSNVANLLLVRSIARRREFTLRAALGAGHDRLTRQVLTESFLLAVTGGLLGMVLALAGVAFVKKFGPAGIPRLQEVSLDWHVFAFALAISIFTGVFFGLVPALSAARENAAESLKEGGQRSAGSSTHPRLRNGFLVSQVALALVLVISAGLLVRTFYHMLRVDPGFRPSQVLTFDLSLPPLKYPDQDHIVPLYARMLENVKAIPGVESAGIAETLPMGGYGESTVIKIVDHPVTNDKELPFANYTMVSPGYFRAVGASILRGRGIAEADTMDGMPVTVINTTMAKKYWPGEDPLGKRVALGSPRYPTWTVVGIVADMKHSSVREEPAPEMYVPYTQKQWPSMLAMHMAVRTKAPLDSMTAALREAIHAADPDVPVAKLAPLTTLVDDSMTEPRFAMLLLASFAGLALLLATIGMYGVISYSVAQRTQEIGIRMALGAAHSHVFRMILVQGARLAGLGLAIGLLVALGVTRFMVSFLYGVQPTDPLTFAAVSALLATIALLACYVPARRATRVDPMVALRYE